MRRHFHAALLATALLAATSAVSFAEVGEAGRQFIEPAAMGGHDEVSSGETAVKSESQAVAAFGRQMVTDHTKMNDELATIAKGLGVTPPDSPSLTQQAPGAATSMLPGVTFDRTYVEQRSRATRKPWHCCRTRPARPGLRCPRTTPPRRAPAPDRR